MITLAFCIGQYLLAKEGLVLNGSVGLLYIFTILADMSIGTVFSMGYWEYKLKRELKENDNE